jgi:hypothetical protein
MECNVGGVEKNVRLATGIASILLGMFAPLRRGARVSLVSLGAIEMVTALSGYCPLNQMIGRNTCHPVAHATRNALQEVQHFAE